MRGYSESNRAPTPLELGCANPNKPCLLEGFLVSDPPLQQVVGQDLRGGTARQRRARRRQGGMEARPVPHRQRERHHQCGERDPGPRRVPERRRHAPAGPRSRRRISATRNGCVYANYSYIDATYQFSGASRRPTIRSADADGNVHVTPGNHIPGIPQHQFKAGAEYAVTPEWKVGADFVAVGSQYFVGDDANQNAKLPAYWVVNLHTSYQISKNVQVFGLVNNLFNQQIRHLRHIFRSAVGR